MIKRRWGFIGYIDRRGKREIADWIASLSPKARQNFKRTLEHLSMKEKNSWERPQSSPLGNNIYVIRFQDENRTQWRVYGEHDDDHGCFVLTNFGTERGGEYIPPSAKCVSTAKERMEEVRGSWNTYASNSLSIPGFGDVLAPSDRLSPGLAERR